MLTRKPASLSVGSHDSAFVGSSLSDNQELSVPDQLALGVRFLQAQTHRLGDTIEMCHTSCVLLDAGPLSDYLAPVADFLGANPDEVVTLLLTNGDAIPVADFADVFDSAGLSKYVFTPNGTSTLSLDAWPTLQEMIDAGTRLVVWMGEFAPQRESPPPPSREAPREEEALAMGRGRRTIWPRSRDADVSSTL